MGASNSKTTISAGAEHALADPKLVSFVTDLTKGNIDAVKIANLVEKLPKNGTPVDESILQLYESNVDSLVDDIKTATGIQSDLINGENIRGMVATARKFGLQAIPYIVGIVATVAAEGNVAVGMQAKSSADKAVDIAQKIEDAMVNFAATSKTPGIVKTLSDKFNLGKKKLFSLLTGKKEFSGAYEELKKHYGPKFGACDCDKIGARDEEDSVLSAIKYMKSSSSAAKTNLAKQIIESISKFVIQVPPASLSDAEKANWLLAHMPGKPGNPNNMDENKMNAACDALIKILNNFIGKEVIKKDLDRVTKCAQAAEMLHSLTMGMHIEYLTAQQDIQTIEDNLTYIAQLEGHLNKEILESMSPEMTEGQKLENLNKQEALKLLSEERERQMNMLRAITTGTFDKTDKEILDLLRNGTILRADISDISDKNPSNKSFRTTLYKLLDMVVITGAVAAYIESALRGIGMTIDEYKKTQSLSQFKNRVAELMPKDGDYKVQEKFTRNAEVLAKNFDKRADIKTSVAGSRDEDSSDDESDDIYGGADRRYAPTESEKKINARKNVRAMQLRIFANQLIRIYSGIERALDDIVPFVGDSIAHGDDLDIFLDRLLFLGEDQTLKGRTYEALAGAVVDPLATQIRMELIGRYKTLVASIDVLVNKSKDQGREKLLKLKSAIEELIKLSDTTSEGFKKVLGGASESSGDISASMGVEYGVGRSIIDLNKAIDKMRAFAKTAKVRENIRDLMTDFKGVNPEYEDMVGKNVGGMLNEINELQKKYLEIVDSVSKNEADVNALKMCENAREFYIGQFDAIRNVWRSAEAVDYYLGNFTHDIRLNTSEIKDIASLLEGVTVHKNWYDAKLGNLLTGIYDNFPTKFNATTAKATYCDNELINNNGEQHYYELLSKYTPGNPMYSAEMVNHGADALKKSKAFVSRFAILKNIVTLFYDLGSKYSGDKTKDSSKYMAPGSLLKTLMDYMHFGSFNVVSREQIMSYEGILVKINPFDSTGVAALKQTDRVLYDDLAGESMKMLGLTLEDLVGPGKDDNLLIRDVEPIYLGKHINGTYLNHIATPKSDDPQRHQSFELMIRSDNLNFMRGNHLLVKTDEMFCNLIKAMLAKILACIETFEIMKKPMLYNVSNSAVRQILGGADVDVKPEYAELYVRMILLIKFYKDIFDIDSTTGFQKYSKLDRSESKLLKISLMPDIDGIYGPLVQYMLSNDRLGVKNYTDSQMSVIVDKINEIINKVSGSGPEEKTQAVIKGFIKDINRRFALVTEEDVKEYKKLVDQERNLWGQLKEANADDYSSNTIVMDQDDELTSFMRLPSDSYVTSGSMPKGIFGSDVVDREVNRKYYGEYYQLYRSFREKIDAYIHKNTSENVPKLSGVIESISKQMKLENNMNRRLELLSKFLESGVDMSEVEKSKYVAFHEFVVSAINGISMIDAYITNIIACGYIADKIGLGNAIIFNRGDAGTVLGNGVINLNDVINAIDDMTLATGINSKAVKKILEKFDNTSKNFTIAGRGLLMNIENDSGKIAAFSDAALGADILKEIIVNIFYGLSGNDLFSVRIGETSITVDYAKLQETIEKTYASVKSTLEKFRPHIDSKIYDLYVGQINNNRNKNAIYELYDDLIRVKLNGAEVYGASESQKLDAKLGRYYGLRAAIDAMSTFIVRHKRLENIIASNVAYDQNTPNIGLLPNTRLPVLTEWYKTKGSGIERMHMSIDGSKFTTDLRFGARYSQMYDFDGPFNYNRNVFSAMNQLIARFMSRTFDANQEKMYKGVVNAFDKVFSYEITNPFANAWPDIWPAIYFDKTAVAKATVTEKDSFNVVSSLATFTATAASRVNDKKKNQLGSVLSLADFITTLGINPATYPLGQNAVSQLQRRNLPDSDGLLLASLAHIIQNIKSNKDSAGGLLNVAESWSEISQATKDTLREELPLFKKYFAELGIRARFLKDLNDKFATSTNIPSVADVIYPKNIRAPTEMSVPYFDRLLAKMIDISEAFEKTVDDMIKELIIPTEYGELFPGFLKAYQSKFNSVPLILPSMIFSYVFNRRSIVADGQNIQLIPATKGTSDRYLTSFINNISGAANSPIVDALIRHFDSTINGPERLIKTDVANAVAGYTKLVDYIGYCRQYKSFFVLPMEYDNTIITNIDEFDKLIYPESYDSTAGKYTKTAANISVTTPWTIGFFVDESAKKNPGITMNLANTVGIRYLNSYFIEQRGVTYLNNITTALVAEKMKVIFDHFKIRSVDVGNANSDAFIVKNILDMNIVPIDFSGFSRFIPYSNIMNYAYTLEQMALDMLIPNKPEKEAIENSMIGKNRIPVVSAETMMYSLLVNPFAKLYNDDRQWNQLKNMFRGDNEIALGRPVFLDDQLFQKLLFESNFDQRTNYDTVGHEHIDYSNMRDTIASDKLGMSKFDMPVYRGSGESDSGLQLLFGYSKLIEHTTFISQEIIKYLSLGSDIDIEYPNSGDDKLPLIASFIFIDNTGAKIAKGDYVMRGRIYNGDFMDVTLKIVQSSATTADIVLARPNNSVLVALKNIPIANIVTLTAGNRINVGWGAQLPIDVYDNAFKTTKTVLTTIPNISTYQDYETAVKTNIAYAIIETIIDRSLRPGRGFNIDRLINIIFVALSTTDDRQPLNRVPVEPVVDPSTILDNIGSLGEINKNVYLRTLAYMLVADMVDVNVAIKFAMINSFSTAPNNLTGPKLYEYLAGELSKAGFQIRKRAVSNLRSSISGTTNDSKQHKITGYFNPSKGFSPSFRGQNIDDNNVFSGVHGQLNYIDPQKMGVSRIRTVNVLNSNDELMALGSMRMNTVLVKFIVFMANAYRLILYRLREDSKNKHARIAKNAEELLDDSNTEFTGFDMFE